MKKHILTLLLFTFFGQAAFAQLQGQLTDEAGEALSFANVAVLAASDSALISGAVTDMEGNFQIATPKAGTYMLRLSAIGLTNTFTAPFEVSGKDFSKDFGALSMKEDVKMLGAVEVRAMRPTVIVEADKMVVSVENTALAAGSTAMEMLEKSPGVWVDQEGNIQLNGKSGVRVMIDGRPSYLDAKELQSMLEGMSAENLKNIELITNPSAKFDAEGSAGIINLELKKNTISGMNGSVNASYQYNKFHTYSTGARINYKKGKWNTFVNAEFAERGQGAEMVMDRQFILGDTITDYDQKGQDARTKLLPSLRLGADYEINDRHSVGVLANLSYNDTDIDFNTEAVISSNKYSYDRFINADNFLTYERQNGTLNLHYKGELDTTGTTLSANVDYVKLNMDAYNEFNNEYRQLESTRNQLLSNENTNTYDIYSAKVDYSQKAFGDGKVEMGLKASYVNMDNGLDFYEHQDGERLAVDSLSNRFAYDESVLAAYVNVNKRFNDTWSFQGGLRAEQTLAEAYSHNLDETTERNYLNLFPSLFLQQKVNDNYQISYSYSRRIDRPNYNHMNPVRLYIDPNTYQLGNPNIRPQFTHSFQVTQTIKQKYNLVLGYSRTKDMISQMVLPNNKDNSTVLGVRNIDMFENISATLVAPVKVTDWWDMNNNLMAAYQNNQTYLQDEQISNTALFGMMQSTHNLMLPGGVRVQLNAGYSSPATFGIMKLDSRWWVDAGFKKSFMDDKVDVSLSFNDIFRSRRLVGTTEFSKATDVLNQYRFQQSVKFGLRYKFNRGEKFKANNNNIRLEELNRAQ